MKNLPPTIAGSKSTLSDNLTASVLMDRNLLCEIGKAVVVFLTPEEATALFRYLEKHQYKFTAPKREQP
jgi:hypothetical protein